MAAYAALVSLMHTIDQIEHHPHPPISLHKQQVQSLTKNVTSLQEFLEGYSHVGTSRETYGLESRIADAAYAAEDIIESHIVDGILAPSTKHGEKITSVEYLYQGLQKVIQDMDMIEKEVMEIKEKMGVQDQLHMISSVSDASSRSVFMGKNCTMVGFDDVFYEMMYELTGGRLDRQIISVVGMGGSGKTTLARNIYRNQVVVQHFDTCAWVTISQEYRLREIVLELVQEKGEYSNQMSEYELGEKLHKKLSCRRYLIVLDDIWDMKVWDRLKFFFPDNKNGSRIVLTTRLSKMASQLSVTSHCFQMNLLDEDASWELLCENVFDRQECPLELEEIGKKIARKCKGLPLSIVVIGGLLAKFRRTREFWEHTLENLNSIVNSEERCSQILQMSYNNLPVHLKPCFLYMGVFKEDSRISVPKLIKLWLGEGFLKAIDGKSLKEAAEEYLGDLVERNLVIVEKCNYNGKPKLCKVHDLVRDFCLREARNQKFFYIPADRSLNIPREMNSERRVCIQGSTQHLEALESSSLARSLICEAEEPNFPSVSLRMLRVYSIVNYAFTSCDEDFFEATFQQANLRCIVWDMGTWTCSILFLPFSISLLWNLQILIVSSPSLIFATSEIWKMRQLRQVHVGGLHLPDPPADNDIVLFNLEKLSYVMGFSCGEETVKRIPNIKKLKVSYSGKPEEKSSYYVNNLERLHKLESFHCDSCQFGELSGTDFLQELTFPRSLKKLTLKGYHVHWEDMLEKIGSLPLLEKLQLEHGSFRGGKWETVEGQFCMLKFLRISWVRDLEFWMTESSHFPRLEQLILYELREMKEIPSGIGEIVTLKSIEVISCGDSAAISAKKILEEQHELGNEGLQVRVR